MNSRNRANKNPYYVTLYTQISNEIHIPIVIKIKMYVRKNQDILTATASEMYKKGCYLLNFIDLTRKSFLFSLKIVEKK